MCQLTLQQSFQKGCSNFKLRNSVKVLSISAHRLFAQIYPSNPVMPCSCILFIFPGTFLRMPLMIQPWIMSSKNGQTAFQRFACKVRILFTPTEKLVNFSQIVEIGVCNAKHSISIFLPPTTGTILME